MGIHPIVHAFRGRLLLSAILLFAGLWGLALAHPTVAAPPNQTIVLPTPTPQVAVPTATPVANDDDDDSDDDDRDDGEEERQDETDPFADEPASDEFAVDEEFQDGELPGGGLADSESLDLEAFFAVIKDERVSLYGEPSTSATVVGTALQGEQYQVVGRNRGVTWYVLCCTENGPGWVSTRSIVREFDLVDAVNLPVIDDLSGLEFDVAPAVLEDRPLGEIPVVELLAFTVTADQEELTVGSPVQLTYRVGNIGRHDLTNIVVRNLLPAGLEIEDVFLENGAFTIDADTQTIQMTWSSLVPGQVETATVDARVTPDAARSTVLEYLATLTTDEEVTTSAGVLLGLPPSAIPDFR